MVNKAIVVGLSIILLVAAIVAMVAGIHRSHHPSSPTPYGSSSKSIAAICAPTQYPDVCQQTLSSTVKFSSDHRDIIKAAVTTSISEVTNALNYSVNLNKSITDSYHHLVLADCKQLLEDAIDELKAVVKEVPSMSTRASDMQTWLSAVITYQQTCLDGFNDTRVKKSMEEGLLNSTKLTSNALALFNEFSALLKYLDLNVTLGPGRRLLGDGEYPLWFSGGDRRLLAYHDAGQAKPNAVVAKDGSGNFKTISAALADMPKSYKGRYVIYVKAGVYEEHVIIDKDKVNVFMYGDGSRKTIISGSKNNVDGVPTFQTATFTALGQGFIAKSMCFRNTAGPQKHQAVALRVQSDMSAFFHCRMDGYQDTLYVHAHRQFYRNCVVSGTVDFIFGDSITILQNCLVIVRRPLDGQQNTVTAQGRSDRQQPTGIVIQNCRIVPDGRLFPDRFKIPSFLGRPWKQYSRTVIMESTIGDLIRPEGWMPWDGSFALDTLFYAEYGNRGPGAATGRRVRWRGFHLIGRREAAGYTAAPFINGDSWLKYTGAVYNLGLIH